MFLINDIEGDTIVIMPVPSEGMGAKVGISFEDEDHRVIMHLDDRLAADLTSAMQQSLAQSVRAG